MKKNTFFLTLIFLVLFFPLSIAQQREAKPVELKQISERLYEILGGSGAQGGMYIGDNKVLVIDAKMDENSVDAVIAEIAKITDKPIKYLVNTHSDGDHVWGNQFFPQTVTFVAHENCRKEFFHKNRDGNESEWNKPELAAYVPSITFRDRMNIYFGTKIIEFWYFGVGHTTGDIVVYFPEEKTAFIGDQIFLTRPQLIHSYKGGNSFEHVKTLTKMLETLDAEKFCSGHSEIADRETIKKHIDQMKKRQEKIKSLFEKDKTLEEVIKEFEENESRLVESIYNEIK
ncbi:MAG: MBL fold metallo-hydrolase [Bacteroidetes bacterium]|nr:MBL fold metallo-hydrolase [Bacteroidota bacterium]